MNDQVTEVISDLVKINNDRIEGYQKAINQTDELDLKELFAQMIAESKTYQVQLNQKLRQEGEERERDSTFAGKIYRAWMDVKATFSGGNRHAILASCEYGEDAAQKAYRQALADDQSLPAEISQLVRNQQQSLKASHDKIRHLRDLEKVNA
ncbi:PA2169 family four-helix-bundle protein [Chitinophaga horti]|uniref:PA2169 family four-helix-bundle protein n=1 Tax=Chitinophaga horti TaxID=2920382 RepID=A0ABY6IZ76_9BACT|nr:PA2169 family four-helix-bundle protein [Chitinophaga horti]UYQ92704.1 PA2169 family four-helix-bundle protein [Chitinophaga horti]